MILDMQSLFSDDQAVAGSNVASTNMIDLGAPGTPPLSAIALVRDIGKGTPIEILIQCTVAHAGTAPTLDVTLEMDTTDAFGSATTVGTAVQMAGAAVGDRASIFFLPEGITERYLRVYYTVGGTTPTITVTAGIALGTQSNK
jgi:hypothetical protein